MTTSSVEQMKTLNDDLARMGTDVQSNLTVFPSGAAMLDVRRNGRAFVMAYSPTSGFGVDELHSHEGLVNYYRFACAEFEPAAQKLRILTEVKSAAPALSLLVIEAKDMNATRQFYNLLGLEFVSEKHGAGPAHFAAKVGTLIFEIYPCRGACPATPARVGFRIPAMDATLELLRSGGARIISEPKDTHWGRRAVVEDPNGNGVELMASD